MHDPIIIEPLTKDAFEPFGDVIEIDKDAPNHPINGGTTQRFHDQGTAIALGKEGRVVISMVRTEPATLPLELTMVERHPFGSQAFVPVQPTRFLVVVAPTVDDAPGTPRAFLAERGQGINYFTGTWHGVLTALEGTTDFIAIDREGVENNLQEHHMAEPYQIAER